MLHKGITILLTPVLLMQGLNVRRTTPKLAEPVGERLGQTGPDPQLSVLILGDSAAAGVGVENQEQALLGQVIHHLRPRFNINYGLFAKTGATTASTLASLNEHTATLHPILGKEHFDVIITSLGVNDITSALSCVKWLEQQNELFTHITQRYKPKLVLVTAVPPLGLFPALPNPLRWSLGQRANQFNHNMQQLLLEFDQQADSQTQFKMINLPLDKPLQDITMLEFMRQMMAADGFHPGAQMYTAWAKLVVEQIQLDRLKT
jgi:lysophospholipase L1-like esterase